MTAGGRRAARRPDGDGARRGAYRRAMTAETDGSAPAIASPWPARTGVSRTELDPVAFLHRTASIHPGRTAVVDGDVRRTYAELLERVNRLASALRTRG